MTEYCTAFSKKIWRPFPVASVPRPLKNVGRRHPLGQQPDRPEGRHSFRLNARRRVPALYGNRDRNSGGRKLQAGKRRPGPGPKTRLQKHLRAGLKLPAAQSVRQLQSPPHALDVGNQSARSQKVGQRRCTKFTVGAMGDGTDYTRVFA